MKKLKKQFKNMKPLFKYFKEYKVMLIIYSIILFIANLSFVFTGYLIGQAVEAVTNSNIKVSIVFLALYLVIEVGGSVVINAVNYEFNKIQCIISRKIGYDVYQKTLKLPAIAFETMTSGEIINRVTNDTEVIVGKIQTLIEMSSRLVSSLLILVYIFINSYIVGLEIVVFLVIYSITIKTYTKRIKKIKKISKKELDRFSSLTSESIRGIREIKTLGITNNLENKMNLISNKLIKASLKEERQDLSYNNFTAISTGLLEVGSFITVAILISFGKCQISFFVAMTYYIYRYTWIIESLKRFSKEITNLFVSFERVSDILENRLYNDVQYGNINIENPKGIIEFKNVTFKYKKDEENVLNNLSVTFPINKKIAIVGASGEGKTTMFNLITRLFDATKGEILIDGINIKNLTEESLNKNISIIRQEPFIFNASIIDNFKFLKKNVTLEEIRKYCALAQIDDYIMSLPKGYDTIIGEGGVNLSGGQKQRLAIARTLLKKSKIILMDEATSALDNISQNAIKESIDKLAVDHTILIVAHRLSTIIDSDIIYVVENGKIIDSGTHKKLMKTCKFYNELHNSNDKLI